MSDRTRGGSLVHPVWYVHMFLWTNGGMKESLRKERKTIKNHKKAKRRKSDCSVGYGLVVQSCQKLSMLMQIEFWTGLKEEQTKEASGPGYLHGLCVF